MADITIEAGSPEAVAYRLMEKVLELNPGLRRKEDLLKLYQECAAAVRGPVAEELLAALNFDDE